MGTEARVSAATSAMSSAFLDMVSGRDGISRDYFDFLKRIGESKSKQEEDSIVLREVRHLRSVIGKPDLALKKRREQLLRVVYCEMLGHEVPFGYIHAVNLTQQPELLDKRVGYLVATLTLHETHELMILMVNSMQRDLRSANHLEVCAALQAACKLSNPETVPALLDLVQKALRHPTELVRKRAVAAMHRFYQIAPDVVEHLGDGFNAAMCDKDPSVMGAALCVFTDIVRRDGAAKHKNLVPSFTGILKQITDNRLPRDYEYHGVPAPWLQVKLLRLLAMLGADDKAASEGMYEVINAAMHAADVGINAGYAVAYECVRTIMAIYPNEQLLNAAASSIARFITSSNQNLKYLGITALARIVQINPSYAAEHQMVVIDCLEDPDETIKRKTIDVLFHMTNASNVHVIADKMVTFLRNSVDEYLREALVSRVTAIAERFAPDPAWFMETMNNVFELGGDLVAPEVAHNLMRLLAEGSGENDEADEALRRHAVEAYVELLVASPARLPAILLRVMAWVLGEYGILADSVSKEELLNRLCDLTEQPSLASEPRAWLLTALLKLVARTGLYPHDVQDVVEKYATSMHVDLRQRCQEFLALTQQPQTMLAVLPYDASCEDIEVDPGLPSLASFVQDAAAHGARPYSPPADVAGGDLASFAAEQMQEQKLRFEAYAAPATTAGAAAIGGAHGALPLPVTAMSDVSSAPAVAATAAAAPSLTSLAGGAKKWSRAGYAGKAAPAATAAAAAPATASAVGAGGAALAGSSGAPPALAPTAAQAPRPQATGIAATPVDPAKSALANALFAGLTGPASPATHATTSTRGRFSASQPAATPAATPAAVPTPAASLAAAPPVADLLSDAPAAAQTSSPAPAIDLLSLYDDAATGSSAATATPSLLDTAAAAPSSSSMISPSASSAFPSILPGDLHELPRVAVAMPLDSDTPGLALCAWKLMAAEAVVVVVAATNTSAQAQDAMAVMWQVPQVFAVDQVSVVSPGGDVSPSSSPSRVAVPAIAPGATASVLAWLTPRSEPASSSVAAVGVRVSFTKPDGSGTTDFANFTVAMTPADLLRPRVLNTAQYGEGWAGAGAERRITVRNPTDPSQPAHRPLNAQRPEDAMTYSLQAFMSVAQSKVHLHPVQIIGSEAIAAASVLPSHAPVFVHGKLSHAPSATGSSIPDALLAITVRSSSRPLAEAIAAFCQRAFL